ncbi:hypothetical protein WJX73_009320 [Symbiochloris irregularis]|uniref:Fe2OG dioxygenase domain-containing protein n=1 Tax=Symbiochloris irregularis TaxID=706552 RepID=A0AAW1PT55_9CHLO
MPGKKRQLPTKSNQKPEPKSNKGTQDSFNFPAVSSKRGLKASTELLQSHGIFTVPGVLTPAEACSLVQAAESFGFEHQSSRGPAFGEALRSNGRIAVHSPAFAAQLWTASGLDLLMQQLPCGANAQGLNPNIRIYRYSSGQHFGKHIDESARLGPGLATQFTLLIYLSGSNGGKGFPAHLSELRGGETVFYEGRKSKEVARVAPEVGLALLHRHGDDCLEHEALAVQHGLKYILRSDVAFRSA